jgi:ABC-type sulfate transport system substrate-binding protein
MNKKQEQSLYGRGQSLKQNKNRAARQTFKKHGFADLLVSLHNQTLLT